MRCPSPQPWMSHSSASCAPAEPGEELSSGEFRSRWGAQSLGSCWSISWTEWGKRETCMVGAISCRIGVNLDSLRSTGALPSEREANPAAARGPCGGRQDRTWLRLSDKSHFLLPLSSRRGLPPDDQGSGRGCAVPKAGSREGSDFPPLSLTQREEKPRRGEALTKGALATRSSR